MKTLIKLLSTTFIVMMLTACPDDSSVGDSIDIAAISGITAPSTGATPASTITATDQYSGTISWSPEITTTFEATTTYTAVITLSAKTGYTFTGIAANFFTVAGSTSATNAANSGVITVVFPATGAEPLQTIDIAALSGVTAPVLGETPESEITETAQYTGTISWDGGWDWSPYFGGNKSYTATITLTVKTGYTLTGVTSNFFTISGADSTSNDADSGVITAIFPATTSVSLGDATCGGKVAYILQSGDPGYVAGEQRGLIAAEADSSSGIYWAIPDYQSISVPSGTETALGTGSSNTDNIIAQNGAGTTYAAGIARSCSDGGYNDWFLPSWDEVYKLYTYKTEIGAFTGALYWSSSEFSASVASTVNSGNGNQHNEAKSNTSWCVRAVRYF
jgi:hypothetical protein